MDFECHLHLLHLVPNAFRTARSLIVWRVGNWCHIRQSCAESNGRHGGHGDGALLGVEPPSAVQADKGPRFYLVQPWESSKSPRVKASLASLFQFSKQLFQAYVDRAGPTSAQYLHVRYPTLGSLSAKFGGISKPVAESVPQPHFADVGLQPS